MLTEPMCVIGAGGHAKVVVDALSAAGVLLARIRVLDSDPALAGTTLLGIPVELLDPARSVGRGRFHVAIGNNAVRARLTAQLAAAGGQVQTVVHPGASVSPFAQVGPGAFVACRAVVAPGAAVGAGVIVNHGAVVDHDCAVGAYSHVAPNATLGGAVVLGDRVLVGAGATLLPAVRVGKDATVGAGAVVLSEIPARQTWVGVPAQPNVKGQYEDSRRLSGLA